MNLFYVPSSEQIINGDHIIRAKFYPAHMVDEDRDDMTGDLIPAHHVEARLDLWLTETDWEEVVNYDGEIKGIGTKTSSIYFKGEAAEGSWAAMISAAIEIPEPGKVQS
jgi:hypothetical protein